MSGLKSNNRRGRPKRNNITALQQHHLKEQSQIGQPFYDLDIKQPLTIIRSNPQQQQQVQRDNSDSSLITPPLSENVTTTRLLLSSSEEEDLSSEDDILSRTPSPMTTVTQTTKVQGVELSRLPKVQFTSLNKGLDGEDIIDVEKSDEEDEEESTYQLQQKQQEQQLLLQHHQLQQQQSMNSQEVKFNQPYRRPENHYIHYIEPSDVELYDTVEYDMDEQDKTWLHLYNKERRKEFLGDISPYLFECIMDKLEKEWFNLIKDTPKSTTEEVVLPEDSACAVCDDTEVENSNAIVFCDGCNVAVHQDCYGIPYIPEGQWLCRKCMISPEFPVSCLFCPNEGGAFKQTNTNQWGHLLCAIWIPEVGVSNTIYMEPIDMIENVPKSRWKLTCFICRKKQGACIQCDNKHCFSAFHVTCAKQAKLCMKMNSHTSQTEGVILKAYCDKHTPKEHQAVDQPRSSVYTPPPTRGRGRGRRRGRGAAATNGLNRQHFNNVANNKVARAHQHHYSTGAPIAPDVILSKIDNLPCVKFSSIRKRPQLVTAIAHYWSLKRESRRGAPLLKRLHLEPWTASSKYNKGETDQLIRQSVITQLRADLEKVRMLSEQVQKRERQKLERTKKQKTYLEMILFPLEYVIRPILNLFMEIDRKKFFLNHVTAEEAPDYASIISKSMCFSEIYQKMASHEYTTLDQFKADIALIWQNSMEYNASDTNYYKVATKLKHASKKLLEVAENKMNRLTLKDGIWDVPVDEAIFDYEAFEEELSVEEPEEKIEIVDEEAEQQLKSERARQREGEERERRRIIENRVRGRKEARARRNQMGLQYTANPKQLKKLRTRNKPATPEVTIPATTTKANIQQEDSTELPTTSQQDASLPDTHIINSESTTTKEVQDVLQNESSQDSTEVHEQHIQALNVQDDQKQKALKQLSITNYFAQKQQERCEQHEREEQCKQQEEGEQSQHEEESPSVEESEHVEQQHDIHEPAVTTISYDIETMQPILTPVPKVEEQPSPAIPAKEASALKKTRETPQKRKEPEPSTNNSSKRPSSRLTRSAGLKASIEEITKRPKISHEARTLFASYNGVSHLDKPVEVYKENRKKSAPVGWVYVEEDEDEDSSDEQQPDAPTAEEIRAAKYAKRKRNNIPVPNFKRGEIVWARVTGYPSHPAKFLNWSDEEIPPKILASRRYQGDVLVEFLKVPEIHKWGWVERNCICEIGDPEVDRARLAESLKKKPKRAIFIEEAKEGYRHAGEILGLDPEPALDAVFNAPVVTKKKKRHLKKF